MTTPPKKGRASQRPTSERKSNAGRPRGRKFTDNLHVPLRPEDRAVVEWLKTRLKADASSIVRAELHGAKKRIEEADAEKNNTET